MIIPKPTKSMNTIRNITINGDDFNFIIAEPRLNKCVQYFKQFTYKILCFIGTLTLGLPLYAEVPFYQFTPNEYRLGIDAHYLSTNANYDQSSNSLRLPSGYGYSLFGSNLNARYTWSKNLSLFGGTSFRNASAENSVSEKSAFNVPFINLGANYNLTNSFAYVIPKFSLNIPISSYDPNGTEVGTSEGLFTTDIGSYLFKDWSAFLFQGYLGYEYKSSGFSSLLHYQAKLYYFIESFALTVGYLGFISVSSDSNNNANRMNYIISNNGGSLLYNSFEPNRGDLFLQVGYVIDNSTRVFWNFSKSLTGENTADYYETRIGFEYRFRSSSEKDFEKKRNKIETEDFEYLNEDTDPDYEEDIKNFNKPPEPKISKPKKVTPQPKKISPSKKSTPTPRRVSPPREKELMKNDYGLEESKKVLDMYDSKTKTTKKAPKKKPSKKSKKPKRMKIDF